MTAHKPLAIVTLAIGMAASQPAAAATLIATGSWSNTQGGSIAKFDASLGTLNSITVEMTAAATTGFWLQSFGGYATDVSLNGTLATNLGAAGYSASTRASTSSTSSFALVGNGSSVTRIAASDFALFTGPGSFQIAALGNNVPSVVFSNGSGFGWGQQDARGSALSANFRVVYDYALAGAQAVPEPATWGMMILGFGLVGVVTRRRTAGKRLTA